MQTSDKVAQVMTKEVTSVLPDDYMTKVSGIFAENKFHHIPVVDERGQLLGLISDTECCRLESSLTILNQDKHAGKNQRLLSTLLAQDVMRKEIITVTPTTTLAQAAAIFHENRFHSLPVVDDHNQLIGILTTFDLIEYAYYQQ